ncbi:MAG: c-type cytochrome [Planctomycetes bacterium]|nr:c-type cytochrome [Planctomycetota bacterium]
MNAIAKLSLVATATALLGATTTLSLTGRDRSPSPVERGRYLVHTSGCHDCHTPWHLGPNGPEPDLKRALSGHPAGFELAPPPAANPGWPVHATATNTAWSGPWGVSFTANLTPDRETGLGSWTVDEFVAAIRTGRHQGRGRQILPPMPAPVYAQMTDADLQAIFAYLQSIPPIANKVPEPLPPR